MAQVGDRELADAVEVVAAARGREAAVVGAHGATGAEVGRDVGDVVAVVGRLGPAGVTGLQPVQARLDRCGEGRDLDTRRRCSRTRASLERPVASSRLQIASPSAAWRAWPTCSGPVGLAETNSTITGAPPVALAAAEGVPGCEDLGDDALARGRAQVQVDEAGPAMSIDSTQRSTAVLRLQRRDQLGARPRAGCASAPWRAASPPCRRGRRAPPGAASRTPPRGCCPGSPRPSRRAGRRAILRGHRASKEFYEARFASMVRETATSGRRP